EHLSIRKGEMHVVIRHLSADGGIRDKKHLPVSTPRKANAERFADGRVSAVAAAQILKLGGLFAARRFEPNQNALVRLVNADQFAVALDRHAKFFEFVLQ